MSNSILDELYNNWVKGYEDLLSMYYPSHGKTGFMEANLVHQFCNQISKIKGSFCWLEAPLEKKGRSCEHIDAVAFLPEKKTTLFIEAKRLSLVYKKTYEIIEDVKRLSINENREYLTRELKNDLKSENNYLVVLADVWTESAIKRYIVDWWLSKNLDRVNVKIKIKEWIDLNKSFTEIMKLNHLDWNPDNQFAYKFDTIPKLENYRLLFGYYKF